MLCFFLGIKKDDNNVMFKKNYYVQKLKILNFIFLIKIFNFRTYLSFIWYFIVVIIFSTSCRYRLFIWNFFWKCCCFIVVISNFSLCRTIVIWFNLNCFYTEDWTVLIITTSYYSFINNVLLAINYLQKKIKYYTKINLITKNL